MDESTASSPSSTAPWSEAVRRRWEALRARSKPIPELETLALKRGEWIAIGALCMVSLVIHLYFRMRGFGEQDQGRFAIYALTWHHTGEFPIDTYTNRTSPFYLIYLRTALACGLSPLGMSAHMNYVNVVFGTMALAPMVLLFRRLTGEFWTAIYAAAFYWFVPAFWIGNGYGIPHVPALFFMLCSLVAVTHALPKEGRSFRAPAAAATLLMITATCLKSDIVMCGLAFPAVAWCLHRAQRRNLAFCVLIPIVSTLAVLTISRVFLAVPEKLDEFAKSFNQSFPFTTSTLTDQAHLSLLKNSLGGPLWITAAIALVLCFIAGRARFAVLAFGWALPPFVFWGFISANGIRHFTVALCAVAALIVVAARIVFESRHATLAGLVLLTALNYDSAAPTDNPHVGTPRLFESHTMMQARNSRLLDTCREFAVQPAPRKLLVGYWAIPYCEYAILARAKRFKRTVTKPAGVWDLEVWSDDQAPPTLVRIRYGPQPVPEFQERERWFIWNPERGLRI